MAMQQQPGDLFQRPAFCRVLPGLFALAALAALATLPALLFQAAPSKQSVLGGYSLKWLLVVGAMGMLSLVLGVLAVAAWRRQAQTGRILAWLSARPRAVMALTLLAGAVFLIGWLGSLLPVYQLGRVQAFFERLKPVMYWLALTGSIFLPLLLTQRFGLHLPDIKVWRENRRLWLAFAAVLLALTGVWLLAAVTGLGIIPDRVHWNDSGIPLIGLQILLAWLVGMTFWLSEPALLRKISPRLLDLLVIAGLWLLAGWLWNIQPLANNFFAPGPYDPAGEHVPFSDAESFDTGSQFMLIGQGYLNGRFYDRALYMGFLALIHTLAGQAYSGFVGLQTAIFAMLPGLIYLLGKRLHTRGLGLAVGLLAVMKEANAILLSGRISTAHSRLLLTEFPTLIVVVVFTIWLIDWLRGAKLDGRFAILAGAALGFGTMLRSNVLFLLPVGWGLTFLGYWKNWRRWLVVILLFMAGAFASVFPWMVRNQVVAGKGFFYAQRIVDVLEDRYSTAKITPTPTPGDAAQKPAQSSSGSLAGAAGFISAHFTHNLIAAFFELPLSPVLDSLDVTVKQGFAWNAAWDGSLPPAAIPMVAINLVLLALGMAAAWQRLGLAGLAPLAVFLAYSLSNGFARASGGRYLVPMDWVVYLYYALGLMQLAAGLVGLFRLPPQAETGAPQVSPARRRVATALLLGWVLLVGALLPLSEVVVPQRYPAEIAPGALVDQLEQLGALKEMGLARAEVEQFLQDPSALILTGRELNPRYYQIDQGEPDPYSAYRAMPYPRLAFHLIGAQREAVAILPLQHSPEVFPAGADVILLGCAVKGRVDAFGVVLLESQPIVVQRSPAAPLVCPLPAPVCDDNRVCR